MTNKELTQEGKIQKLIRDSDYLTKKHPLVYRGPIVRSESIALTLEFIRKNYNKIGIDWIELQRFFEEWDQDKIDSYMTTVTYGMEKKDLFQLVEIDTQIEFLENLLKDKHLNKHNKEKYNYCLDYFKEWKDAGKKYLCIDGQHRLFYLHQFLTSKITFEVVDGYNKEWIVNNKPITMSETLFEDYIPEIQNLINDIEVQTTFYSKAPALEIYSMIFSTSNKGRSIHSHEDRMILNPGDFPTYLKDKILKENKIREEINGYISYGSPSFTQKGDTHIVTKMFPWWSAQQPKPLTNTPVNYNFSDKENDYLFKLESISKSTVTEYHKIWTDLYRCLTQGEPKSKLKLSTVFNLFYYIYKFSEEGIAGKKFSIEVYDDFLHKFLKSEDDRKEKDFYVRDTKGKNKGKYKLQNGEKIEDHNSYSKKCKTTNHKNFLVRIKKMKEDIHNDYQTLLNEGTIKEKGSRKSNLTTYDVAAANDFKDGRGKSITAEDIYSKKGKNFQIDEHKPVSQGGKRDPKSNKLSLLEQTDNTGKFNYKQKVNKSA